MSIYRRVLRYYRPFLGQTVLGLVLSLFGIALNLLKPWPFKIIVDDLIPRARDGWRRASACFRPYQRPAARPFRCSAWDWSRSSCSGA